MFKLNTIEKNKYTTKALKILRTICIIFVFLLAYNGARRLFIPRNDHWKIETVLVPSKDSEAQPLGDEVNITIDVDVSLWYNYIKCKGIVTINNTSYDIYDKTHLPRSFLGDLYEAFKYAGTYSWDFDEFYIPLYIDGYKAGLAFSDSGCRVNIYTQDETIKYYRKSFILSTSSRSIYLPLTE